MKTTLLIMAAGIGSRFGGGVKQLEPVGLNDEIIMDYSVHDAIAAGFNKLIFVIRKDIEADFRERIGDRIEALCNRLGVEVHYAFQSMDAIPAGFSVPEGRTKPWGTGQAVLAARELIHEPFIAINADDIEKNKIRGDLGITYDRDVIRLIGVFRDFGLYVSSVVLTRFHGQTLATAFQSRLEGMGIRVYHHYSIEGYPANTAFVVSEEGFGKNEYIETSRSVVVVTAPGPGSGKMATCLSQLYHEHKRGIRAGYAKYETFPIWNLPLRHPVNLAYEAATADLNDVNMIDPFHLEAYGVTTVNYNRDIEIFPVVNAMFELIAGQSPYHSPTDMGVNMAGNCIVDDAACCEASCNEIVRRYFKSLCALKNGAQVQSEVYKLELLMNQAGLTLGSRPVEQAAHAVSEKTGGAPAAAIELPDGTVITGKTGPLLGAASSALLNALKKLAGINKKIRLISPTVISPLRSLKCDYLGNHNPRLHSDEVLVALSICAATNPLAELAMEQLSKLKGCEVHSTVILSPVDEKVFKRLGVNLTCEPKYSV